MQERHSDDLVGAYVLDALEPSEFDEIERHLETCARCRALVQHARITIEYLLAAVPQVQPPASLRARVMARIASERAGTGSPDESNGARSDRLTASPTRTADIPSGSGLARNASNPFVRFIQSIGGGSLADDDATGQLLRRLLADPECIVVGVGGTDSAKDASARLVGARSRREAVLITNALQPITAEQVYQVWALRGGQPEPNALFTINRHGQGASAVRFRLPLDTYDAVAVTPEPLGGSQAPTGPIVLVGTIKSDAA